MTRIDGKIKLTREEIKAIDLLANIDCKTGDCNNCIFKVLEQCVLLELAIVQENLPAVLYERKDEFYDD